MKYFFKNIEKCNMCGDTSEHSRILGRRMNRSQGIRPTKKGGILTTIVQCRSCSLVYPNPIPIPDTLEQHYGTPPEDYWQPAYFEINENYFKGEIETFFNLYGKQGNLKALDIGAGIGKCMIALKNSGFEVYGLEPSEPFYQRALEKMNIPADNLKLSRVEDAEYSEESFDFITFGAVLEHLFDPSSAILSTLKWVKRGGLIHIEVPSSGWLTNKIFNLVYKVQGLDYAANISPMHSPFHLYEFGLQSFKAHADRHNYEIALYKYSVCDTFLPKILNPIVKPLMAATDTGMQLEIWLRKPES